MQMNRLMGMKSPKFMELSLGVKAKCLAVGTMDTTTPAVVAAAHALATVGPLRVSVVPMDDTRQADRELADAVLANRPGAFERLLREYQGLCWHIIQRMGRNPEDARELCQDTFLRVHQCLHQYRGESALKSWIGRVAWTIALRHLQHKRIPLVDNADAGEGSL